MLPKPVHHGLYFSLSVRDDTLTNKRFTTGTEQLTKCCEPLQKLRVMLGTFIIDSTPVIYVTGRSTAIFLLWLYIIYCFMFRY